MLRARARFGLICGGGRALPPLLYVNHGGPRLVVLGWRAYSSSAPGGGGKKADESATGTVLASKKKPLGQRIWKRVKEVR
jgi:hypothetical protein